MFTQADLALGENLCLGSFFHLAESRARAIRELTPFYEENVKMFAPLGFVPGMTPAQVAASGAPPASPPSSTT